jgi:hypothetical protein
MSQPKTTANDADAKVFVGGLDDPVKRQDSLDLIGMFSRLTGEEPIMWGGAIIGFGKYNLKSTGSSRGTEWPLVGFSPRKQNLTLYVLPGANSYDDMLQNLGKHKASVSCLYINKLDDIDRQVLERIIKRAYSEMKELHAKS